MNELCLFAGGGGGSIASFHFHKWRTVCYVEWDKYCQKILQARIKDGLLSDAPIWDDIKTFNGKPWRGCVDIITAGFPCQPFSVAGKQKGIDDDRNGWPDTIRIIREVKPKYCLLENVAGLLANEYIESFLQTWPKAGMMQDGKCYRLPKLERRIRGIGSGLWATPRASLGMYARMTEYGASVAWERKGNLEDMILRYYPQQAIGNYISPLFVEKLMGWPIGWTDLKRLETGKFHNVHLRHGKF